MDFFGRSLVARSADFSRDLVDEWKEQALASVRRRQRELRGRRLAWPWRWVAAGTLKIAKLVEHRTRLRTFLAWTAIGKNDPLQAHMALQALPAKRRTVDLVAAYLACCNRNEEALALLCDARSLGQSARETTKLLIELLVKTGARQQAIEVIGQDKPLLTPSDWSALERAGILPARVHSDPHAG